MMFGIPIMTLVSMAVTYGPEVVSFIRTADPLLHQLVTAAAPLAKSLIADGMEHKSAITQSVGQMSDANLALVASYEDKAKGES